MEDLHRCCSASMHSYGCACSCIAMCHVRSCCHGGVQNAAGPIPFEIVSMLGCTQVSQEYAQHGYRAPCLSASAAETRRPLAVTHFSATQIRSIAQVTRFCLCTICVQYTLTSFYGAEIPLLFCVVDKVYSGRLDVKQYRVFCVPI